MKRSNVIAIRVIQKRVFWVLISFILILFVSYGYFVSTSIMNVIIREEVEDRILAVNSEISELEFTYLAVKDTISLEFAYAKGFVDISTKEFVARKSVLGGRLTLNINNEPR